jgi:hypothetical protein
MTSYNGKPTASAISLSCMDAVGWVTCIRAAAALTLPVSAKAKNKRNCRKLIFIDFYLYKTKFELILLLSSKFLASLLVWVSDSSVSALLSF